jgi:putative phosphoesterase
MRIAVLSDTHNRLPAALPALVAEAYEIWHLGDVTDAGTLAPLLALRRPFRIVRGNCDEEVDWPMRLQFELEGFRILLMHVPPGVPQPGVDLILHGHTHLPRHEAFGKATILNPGAAGGPSKGAPPSFAWLTLENGGYRWEIVGL